MDLKVQLNVTDLGVGMYERRRSCDGLVVGDITDRGQMMMVLFEGRHHGEEIS